MNKKSRRRTREAQESPDTKKKKKSPGFYELARIGMLQKQMAEMSTKIAAEKARQSIINEENLMERPRKVKFPLEDVAVDPDKVSAEQDSQGLRQPAEKAKVVQKQTTLKLNINANDSDGFNSVSSPAEAMQQRKVTLHQGSLKMEDRVKGTGSLEQPKKAESAVASSLAGLKEKYHQNQTNNKTDNNNINPTSAHESVKNINTSTERMSDVSIELSADSSTSCDYFENSRGTLQDFLIEKVKGEQSSTHTMKKDATVLDITNDSQPSSDIKQKGELPKLRWKLATLATEQMKKEMPPAILPESSLKRRCRCISWFVGPWNKLRRILNFIVSDVLFDLFISFSIIVNTVFMATEHYGMHPVHEEILFYLNFVFAGIFIAEAVMKIIAKGKKYFSSGWNIFDLLIVLASITDLFLDSTKSLSVLRTLRLLRVIKLAKSWPTMRVLMTIIVSTLSALGYLTIILFLIIYIFAVLGLQLFREDYKGYDFDGTEAERWHFEDFYHSFMMIFRVLCGEWVEPLHQCLRVSDKLCFAVFFPTLIIGNFIVLNLFLALLINAFATENINKHKQSHKDSDKLAQGVKRLVYIFSFVKNMNKGKQKNISTLNVEEDVEENDSRRSKQKTSVIRGVKDSCPKTNGMVTEYAFKSSGEQDIHYNIISSPVDPQVTDDTKRKISRMKRDITSHKLSDISGKESDLIGRNVNENIANARTRKDENANAKSAKADKRKVNTDSSSLKSADHDSFGTEWGQKSIQKMHSCFPNWLRKRMKWIEPFNESERGQKWLKIRYAFMNFVDHSYFEWLALFIIFASSITLAFEDIYLYKKEKLKQTLNILNITFCVLFAFEMLLKFVAYGLTWYFTSFWCLLDFFVVTISFLGVLGDNLGLSHILAFRSVRTLRAIRPLRAISRWQGMKIVVNSLMRAIPAIIHVILVGIVFWLAFSIIGVQLFSGRFYKCINETTGKIFSPKIIPNRNVCEDLGQTWENSKINFDHVAAGLLALFQVATFEGWMEVMRDAVDATEIDHQPAFENNTPAYLYFVVFIVFGSFFTLNLFISVIIDNFHVLKKKYEGSYLDILLTDGQRNYYNTLKRLGGKKPQKTIKMPKSPFLKFFYRLTLSKQFEMAVVLLIFLNMIAMAVEHHEQSKTTAEVLSIINICITVVFGVEAILKLLGLRLHYFRVPWNIFDFTVLIMSVIDIVLEFLLKKVFIKPNLLRSIRLFRIGRVLRLVKALKGIRKLLFALIISLPAIFNIGALLFLIIYIYAIIGMSLFGDIKLNGALNEGTNFQTFSNAFVLLIRLSTSAGWNEILDGLLIEEPSCDPNYRTLPDGKKEKSPAGDCGVPWLAIPFMVSYIILVYLIIINMYIAVILENFNQAHQQEEVGITEEDFEMFYVVWERYDPNATQFIHVDQLSDFVADLEEPLKVEKPNEIALVSFDLPIMEGERIHCLDILMALINNLMSDIEQSHELLELKLKMQMKFAAIFPSRENYKVIATTLERKKEDVAARTLQRAWRSHKNQQTTSIVASIKTELLRRDTLADTHGSDLGNRITNAVNFIFGSRSSKSSFSANRDRSASQGIIFSRNRFLSSPSVGISGVAPQSRHVTQAAKCENTIDST